MPPSLMSLAVKEHFSTVYLVFILLVCGTGFTLALIYVMLPAILRVLKTNSRLLLRLK